MHILIPDDYQDAVRGLDCLPSWLDQVVAFAEGRPVNAVQP